MSAGRLSLGEAERLIDERLGATPRAAHSRFVGLLMARLAWELDDDAGLWRVVGLVHDLDYFAVDVDWSRHGVLTATWLAGRLPPEALEAIAAHDHRSGVNSSSRMAQMLKLADALAVLDGYGAGSRRWRRLAAGRRRWRRLPVAGRSSLASSAGTQRSTGWTWCGWGRCWADCRCRADGLLWRHRIRVRGLVQI